MASNSRGWWMGGGSKVCITLYQIVRSFGHRSVHRAERKNLVIPIDKKIVRSFGHRSPLSFFIHLKPTLFTPSTYTRIQSHFSKKNPLRFSRPQKMTELTENRRIPWYHWVFVAERMTERRPNDRTVLYTLIHFLARGASPIFSPPATANGHLRYT